MALITHAYSRNNSGDGLLVDLAVDTVEKSAEKMKLSRVIVCDGDSFNGYLASEISRINIDQKSKITKTAAILSTIIKLLLFSDEKLLPKSARADAFEADAIFAVGGGYLRAGRTSEALKMLISHGPQLKYAAKTSKKTIYLPQSIGPLRGPIGKLIKHWLKSIDIIFLRDDISPREVTSKNTKRVPDMAIQELASTLSQRKPQAIATPPVYLIARDLHGGAKYRGEILRLLATIPSIEPLIQSTGRGNDDRTFYKTLGINKELRTVQEATNNNPGIVISVRLHGAIQSLINNCPTIHLSYERKGFAAYKDLGLEQYVINAKNFSSETISALVKQLILNQEDYWETIKINSIRVLEEKKQMECLIKHLVDPKG